HQTLLDSVSEHIADLREQGRVVEDRLSGIPPFPEGSSPIHKRSDLLRDVAEEVLHELRKIRARSANDQVQVIRGEVEDEELDTAQAHRPGKYAAEDFISLGGWT